MFLTDLTVRQIDKKVWELTDALIYSSDLVHDIITVPAKFRTDFASVPRLPLTFLIAGNKGQKAAVVHDWLYSTQRWSRDVCDDVFHEALLASGHSKATAMIMWLGVRAGGWAAWRRDNVPQVIPMDIH